MGRALSFFIALSMALGAVFADRAQAAESVTPPHTIAEAKAVAARLANATGAGGHAELALQADRIALIPADWLVACLQPLGDATPGSASPCVLRGRRMLDGPLPDGISGRRRLAGVSGPTGPGHCRRSADSHPLERG